ncbi:hypothetical protein MNV49_000571 [Pseudohyphozyma bogoriensis]|nr:hypothetical protein MNV49_000571 [Pseudohyphozyma bogoriensis]
MDLADSRKGSSSSVKLKGLTFDKQAAQPAFLRNAYAALSGAQPSSSGSKAGDGRPAIPTRPGGEEGDESEEDEWDMGRGEEAPAVVVLNEGKHLDREEVDRLRAEAKAGSAPDPLATKPAEAGATKNTGSLSFSTSSKRKATESAGAGASESWEDVIKRSKVVAEEKAASKEEEAKAKEKAEKKKKKEKAKDKKKIGMLSFNDE